MNRRANRAERSQDLTPRIATGCQESCDDCRVAFTCRNVQGRGAADVGRLNLGSAGKEPFDRRKISSPRSVVQLGGSGL